MPIKFNAAEVFDMAMKIEQNGSAYYRAAADNFRSNERAAKLLTELSGWEESHRLTFAAMREDLLAREKSSFAFDPAGDVARYLHAMADGNVFNVKDDPSKLLTGKERLEDVFKTAINMEKDSIVFYLGLKDLVPEKLGRDKIDSIIREEMSHIGFLNRELQVFKSGGEAL